MRKMLMKLTPDVNFINILRASLTYEFFSKLFSPDWLVLYFFANGKRVPYTMLHGEIYLCLHLRLPPVMGDMKVRLG